MKRLFTATSIALSLFAGSVALADDQGGGRFGNGRGNVAGDYRGNNGRGDHGRNEWRGGDRGRGDHGGNNWRGGDHRFDRDRNNWRNDHRYDGRNNWRDDQRFNDHRFDRGRDWRDGRRDFRYDGRHDRGYGHRDYDRRYYGPRYDGRYYGRYRVGPYHRPYGYYSHYWRRGDRLPRGYYAPRYIVNDYYSYDLRHPGRGYHWVRVNDDVVLAAITTGIVLDIAYNRFY